MTLEIDNLVGSLLHRRAASWKEHLRDVALQAYTKPGLSLSLYHLSEVKGVTQSMAEPSTSPLRAVLERRQGTLSFGYALRQLGRANPASLRDIIDILDAIHDCNKLLRVLHQAVQECWVASAKNPFMKVPDDGDLIQLTDDIERYGVQMVASLLIILSSLRYPRTNDMESSASSVQSAAELPPENDQDIVRGSSNE